MKITCEYCSEETQYCDSIPCADSESGYRIIPLCWLHAQERKQVATNRVCEAIVYRDEAYMDLGYASKDCICRHCHRDYGRHPGMDFCPTQVLLCNNQTAKL